MIMKKLLLISAGLLVAACSNNANSTNGTQTGKATSSTSDEAAIRKTVQDMNMAKTAKEIASSFTEDGEWIMVGQEPHKGRATIEKAIEAVLTPSSKLVMERVETKEVILFNDHQALAKNVGTYHLEVNGKAEPSKKIEFADYFVKSADGAWRAAYEINSDDNG